MAELDPLIAEILLKGDEEFLSKLKKVGEDGAEAFEKLAKAVENGATSAQAITGSFHLIEAAIAGIAAATITFIEQQTELSQKTILLAEAFGTTAGQLQDLEAVFASSGVKVEQFERFANRLTVTIAREWPTIAESIKNYATENDAATLRVQSSILRVRDAQNALADNSQDRFAQMGKDSTALEAAYIKLQFAAQHAAQEQLGAAQSVRGAELSVTAAVQALAAARGTPPSAGEKQSLAIAQAQQSLDQARKAEVDARIAQQEKAATASLKQAQLEQEYDDIARKAAKNARDDAEQRIKDQNAVKEAVIQRAEAEQRAEKIALTNIVDIRDALDGIVKGNKAAAETIDVTRVSVQNLTRAIIAQAAETTKNKNGQPDAYEVLIQLSETLSKATKEQISEADRLAIVNRLAGTSMQALGASVSELKSTLERGPEALKKFSDQAKAIDLKSVQHNIEEFRGELADFFRVISLGSQQFAGFISPAFTAFLKSVQSSIESNNGILHFFIEGIKELGREIGRVGEGIGIFIGWVAKMFNTQPGVIWKALIVSIGVVIAATASAILAWPIIIATVVTAVGYLAANWDKVKQGVFDAWQAIKDSAIGQFVQGIINKVNALADAWASVRARTKDALSGNGSGGVGNAAAQQVGREAGAEGNPDGVRLATGGQVDGPGTSTSDSIFARLSRGEFVVKAAAVQQYGASLFHALNNMQLPGFAGGGLVPSPVRLAGAGEATAQSTLNLTIGDRTFSGLRGAKSTIDDLSAYAIGRQTSAAGSNPSWMS